MKIKTFNDLYNIWKSVSAQEPNKSRADCIDMILSDIEENIEPEYLLKSEVQRIIDWLLNQEIDMVKKCIGHSYTASYAEAKINGIKQSVERINSLLETKK